MNVPPPLPPVVMPSLLTQDTPCIGCQYNLRGLAGEGLCPECGTPIEKSVRGNFLRYADPAYVRRLASGTRMLFWATLVSLCAPVLTRVWQKYLFDWVVTSTAATPLQTSLIFQMAMEGIKLLCSALVLAGACRVTTRDPAEVGGSRGLGLAQAIRAGAALLLSWEAFKVAMMLLGRIGLRLNFSLLWWVPLFLLMTLLAIAFALGLCLWFSRLAMRIPDHRLAGRARVVMWGLAVMTLPSFIQALLFSLRAVGILSTGSGMPTQYLPVTVLEWVGDIGSVVFLIWWLILLARYRREFLAQAELARVGMGAPELLQRMS